MINQSKLQDTLEDISEKRYEEELEEKHRPTKIGRPRKEKPEKIQRQVGRPRKVLTSEEIERKQNPKSRGRPKIYEDGTIRKPLDPDYLRSIIKMW